MLPEVEDVAVLCRQAFTLVRLSVCWLVYLPEPFDLLIQTLVISLSIWGCCHECVQLLFPGICLAYLQWALHYPAEGAAYGEWLAILPSPHLQRSQGVGAV